MNFVIKYLAHHGGLTDISPTL